MTVVRTLDGGTRELDESTLNAFRARLRGPLCLPDSNEYKESCKIWNGMVTSRPAMVVRATGAADVVECVNFCREHRIPFSPRGGGHNIAGTALPDGGLMIDLNWRMRGVLVDPVKKVARVQAGCTLGDVDRETQVFGLATVMGFVSLTGVAGLTLGGGFGYLSRRFGWTVDSLVEVEMVTADGKVITVSDEQHPDLFWAVRGAGANFGVVTSFTFRLYPVGPIVTGGPIGFGADAVHDVLGFYRELIEKMPRELCTSLTVRKAPPAPFIPKEHHGKPLAMIIACHTGTKQQAEADLAALRNHKGKIFDLIGEKPYTAIQQIPDPNFINGDYYYWKSGNLAKLNDQALAIMEKYGTNPPTPWSQVGQFTLGGAIKDRAEDDGAVGNRDAELLIAFQSWWKPGDTKGDEYIAWARAGWEELQPHTTGTYVNFLTADSPEDAMRSTYRNNYDRIAALKAKYDPDNLFRSNKNVPPRR